MACEKPEYRIDQQVAHARRVTNEAEPAMSALGHKRTFSEVCAISALPPKADINRTARNVRYVPKADIAGLFDHLVSATE